MIVTFGHIGFHDGVQEPAAALDDAVLLLLGAGQEPGCVDDEHQRDLEHVAEPDEPGGLVGGFVVDRPGQVHRLVGDHADRTAVDPGEPGDDRRPALRGDVEEVAVVEDPQQDLVHVVGHVVGIRHDRVEFQVGRRDLRLQSRVDDRRLVEAVGGQERQEVTHVLERLGLGVHHLVDVAVAGLGIGPAQLVEADLLAGDFLDHIRAR